MQLIPQLGRHTQRRRHVQGYKGKEGRRRSPTQTVNLLNCNSLDLLLFAQPGSKAGIKRRELLQLNPRFAESGASAVSILVQKQVDKCKNRPLAANSNLGGNFVQFSLGKQIQRFVNWHAAIVM